MPESAAQAQPFKARQNAGERIAKAVKKGTSSRF
jgi:hypothetical protein